MIINFFWDNWFFFIGGGVEVLFGDNDYVGKFRDCISLILNVVVGKWFILGLGLWL